MELMTDPRPSEPAWVTDMRPAPSGKVEWEITRRRWNRETKKYDKSVDCRSGSVKDLLLSLAEIMNTMDPECSVWVDASQFYQLVGLEDRKSYVSDCDFPYDHSLFAKIEYDELAYDEYTSMDEFLSEVEWAAKESKVFNIEMDWMDPTP